MNSKNTLDGKVVYFSHPTFTFRTDTEKYCQAIFKKLKIKKIINPANYGLRDNMKQLIKGSDAVIGMSISNKLTYLVWNEMEFGERHGLELYTIMVESKHDIGPLVEGIPDNVKKMSLDESKLFTSEILKKEHRETVYSILVGNWGKRF